MSITIELDTVAELDDRGSLISARSTYTNLASSATVLPLAVHTSTVMVGTPPVLAVVVNISFPSSAQLSCYTKSVENLNDADHDDKNEPQGKKKPSGKKTDDDDGPSTSDADEQQQQPGHFKSTKVNRSSGEPDDDEAGDTVKSKDKDADKKSDESKNKEHTVNRGSRRKLRSLGPSENALAAAPGLSPEPISIVTGGTVSLVTYLFTNATSVLYGDILVEMPADTVKFAVEVHSWPFCGKSNALKCMYLTRFSPCFNNITYHRCIHQHAIIIMFLRSSDPKDEYTFISSDDISVSDDHY
jgi:hypothetical protein